MNTAQIMWILIFLILELYHTTICHIIGSFVNGFERFRGLMKTVLVPAHMDRGTA